MVEPYRPGAQLVQEPSPGALYLPTAHCTGVLLVLPGAHSYPWVQLPEHSGEVTPTVPPYTPAGHRVHAEAPVREYLPTGHAAAVGTALPATQKYPALQLPEHAAEDRAVVAPYRPGPQGVQTPAPPRE